jgi:hypothetical protein
LEQGAMLDPSLFQMVSGCWAKAALPERGKVKACASEEWLHEDDAVY